MRVDYRQALEDFRRARIEARRARRIRKWIVRTARRILMGFGAVLLFLLGYGWRLRRG